MQMFLVKPKVHEIGNEHLTTHPTLTLQATVLREMFMPVSLSISLSSLPLSHTHSCTHILLLLLPPKQNPPRDDDPSTLRVLIEDTTVQRSEKGLEKWKKAHKLAQKFHSVSTSRFVVGFHQHGTKTQGTAVTNLSSEIVLKQSAAESPDVVKQSLGRPFFTWCALNGPASNSFIPATALTLHTRIHRQFACKIQFGAMARWISQLTNGLHELHTNGFFIESLLPNSVFLHLDPEVGMTLASWCLLFVVVQPRIHLSSSYRVI